MDFKTNLTILAKQIIDSSGTRLTPEKLVNKIIELKPTWLPQPIYNPRESYHAGQRIFHASPALEEWFIVEEIMPNNSIWARFDNGRRIALKYNEHSDINFPTTLHEFLEYLVERYDLLGYRKEPLIKELCKRHNIECFYRIDPINNLAGILDYGILCHNKVDDHEDISDPEVQKIRHSRFVPYFQGLTLHDFVPIFISPMPPMLSKVRHNQSKIAYLHISPEVLFLPGVIFTDGNASSKATTFFERLEDFERLDWVILKQKYWSSDDESTRRENIRKRSAEILVLERLPVRYIKKISVYDSEAYRQVMQILQKKHIYIYVERNPYLYF